MSDINRQLKDELEQLKQLKRLKQLQNSKAQTDRKKSTERRKFIVGKIFLDAFPEYLDLHPQKSVEEDALEFAPLINFLSVLSANKELVNFLKCEAANITASPNTNADSK